MPSSEPMTMGEVARRMDNLGTILNRIETKLDNKNDKEDQLRKDQEQDKAIEHIENKIDKIVWGVAATALGAVGSLFLALANKGMIQ